jgi:hypothetical protein
MKLVVSSGLLGVCNVTVGLSSVGPPPDIDDDPPVGELNYAGLTFANNGSTEDTRVEVR